MHSHSPSAEVWRGPLVVIGIPTRAASAGSCVFHVMLRHRVMATNEDSGVPTMAFHYYRFTGGLLNNSSIYFDNFSYFLAGRDLHRVINLPAFLTLSSL